MINTAPVREMEMPWADERVIKALNAENTKETLVIEIPPDDLARFRAQPGTDDLDKLLGLLAQAA